MLASQEVMVRQMGGITLKRKKKSSTQVKVRVTKSHDDTKIVTKKEDTKELHNLGELIRTTTRVLKERGLKIFATIVGRSVACSRIVDPRKILESNVATSKKEMEDE